MATMAAGVASTVLSSSIWRYRFCPNSVNSKINNISQLASGLPVLAPVKRSHLSQLRPVYATARARGFGPQSKKAKKIKKSKPIFDEKSKRSKPNYDDEDDDDDEDEEDDRGAGVIPEVVTNRMIGRMALSVGLPLFVGLLFFPFFYYLKVGLKIDVPTWVPFIVSFFFFGSALVGVSYGIVSASWDPSREGSLLGWTEARKNFPVFWQSIWGGSAKK